MKWLDIPPVWLVVSLIIAYWLPYGLPKSSLLGGATVFVGIGLMILAVWEMRRHRTTPIPHMEADALVSSGIFAYSRNPIYLGDVLVLFGLSLRWGGFLALLLIPILMWVLQSRFIKPEEDRLRAKFGDAFEYYCTQTRRWV